MQEAVGARDPNQAAAAPKTCREALELGRAFLARKGLIDARKDADLLLAHVLGTDRLGLYTALDKPIEPAELERARALFVRRAQTEPVAYLTGAREFYGRSFAVDRRVLIPRPESELLIDLARAHLAPRTAGRAEPLTSAARAAETLCCADFGTGSGCLAITLALEFQGARVIASDVSADALEVARANAKRLAAEVDFVLADGLDHFSDRRPEGGFDVLVSNPPYVDPKAAVLLPRDVRDFEPHVALFAPQQDPDLWVRRLVQAAPALLAPAGRLWVELGHDQGARALELAQQAGLCARLVNDLERIPRVLEARLS